MMLWLENERVALKYSSKELEVMLGGLKFTGFWGTSGFWLLYDWHQHHTAPEITNRVLNSVWKPTGNKLLIVSLDGNKHA